MSRTDSGDTRNKTRKIQEAARNLERAVEELASAATEEVSSGAARMLDDAAARVRGKSGGGSVSARANATIRLPDTGRDGSATATTRICRVVRAQLYLDRRESEDRGSLRRRRAVFRHRSVGGALRRADRIDIPAEHRLSRLLGCVFRHGPCSVRSGGRQQEGWPGGRLQGESARREDEEARGREKERRAPRSPRRR